MSDLGHRLAPRLLLALSLLGPIESLDWRVQQAVQSVRPSPLERPMRLASDIGRPQLVLGVLLAIAAFGGPPGAATARYAILALIPTNLAVEGLKRVTHRSRPDGDRNPSNASFPSSHAANAFSIAWVFSRRWRSWTPAFILFAVTVGFSRIYLNRHFLSDVLCAAVIGVVSAWAVARMLDKLPDHDSKSGVGRLS